MKTTRKNPLIPNVENIRRWALLNFPKYEKEMLYQDDFWPNKLRKILGQYFNKKVVVDIVDNDYYTIASYINTEKDRYIEVEPLLRKFFRLFMSIFYLQNITQRQKLLFWKYYMSSYEILDFISQQIKIFDDKNLHLTTRSREIYEERFLKLLKEYYA